MATPFVYVNDRVLITTTVSGWGMPLLLDTGANSAQIPEALADQLIASDHATEGDGFISHVANGTSSHVRSVIVDSVVAGTHIVRNVEMGVGPERLLGLNVLSHLGADRFTIDTQKPVGFRLRKTTKGAPSDAARPSRPGSRGSKLRMSRPTWYRRRGKGLE